MENIQDRTVSLMIRAGYATATVAKLIEKVHDAQTLGKNIDKTLYDKARDYYEESFYRVIFIGAENSVGFHNRPSVELHHLMEYRSGEKSEAFYA